MNILLISQCEKKALTETRRLLDQFAERRGERTWQTAITLEGLDTLRRLLRKTARKNTAVACHWIRGLDHSELLWTVGDARRFNAQGAVPTNTTTSNVLRAQDENDWHSGEDIDLLAALAALLHDLGKACRAFILRLRGKWPDRNDYRHEWVSLRLFEAFVGDDDDATWLARLAGPDAGRLDAWLTERFERELRDGLVPSPQPPFARLAGRPLAQAVGWLVVTHHRLPVMPIKKDDGSYAWLGTKVVDATSRELENVLLRIQSTWNELPQSSERGRIAAYWDFPHGLPVTTPHWQRQAARIAKRLLLRVQHADRGADYVWLAQPYVMHLARLTLMLADHHYSSLKVDDKERVKVPDGYPLRANTPKDGRGNQTLDEHLIGVAKVSREIAHALPRFDHALPRLGKCRTLRQRAGHERFRWQDKAADLAATLRERSRRQGAFIVNMASTGCGKTLANARVMYALADPELGLRCAFAMGLRTLTLQTGREMRSKLGLGDDELAIRVGGAASRELFEHYEAEAEKTGSASRQELLDEDADVEFEEGRDGDPLLRRVFKDPAARKLLEAPVLVCTIDHLTPATESQRGGRQIAPMLRLLSGDLVLDEPDDFGLEDLPALTRLVHWAGLLGSRVLLSSATLPPSLVRGLFEAYRNGRAHFNRHRGDRPSGAEAPPAVCCLWVDEFDRHQADCPSGEAFASAHGTFARQRHQQLAKLVATEARRRVEIVPLDLSSTRSDKARHEAFAKRVLESAELLHRRHAEVDPKSGKRVSFGLVRMANIEPLYEVALALYRLGAPEGMRIHLCVYHSQFPLLVRSAIENRLDAALKRHEPEKVFGLADVRRRIDGHPEQEHLFVVLGSAVTEVGRDHSYRWAVAEPSSLRSLIQLLGRVRRHQGGPCDEPNVHVLSHNLRHFEQPGRAAFCRPGYERDEGEFHLASHDLRQLLAGLDVEHLDARPRIVEAAPLQQQHRLADLEHARTAAQVLPSLPASASPAPAGRRVRASAQMPQRRLNAASWWCEQPQDALTTALLPQQQRFRDDSAQPEVELRLMPDEDGDRYVLKEMVDERKRRDRAEPWLDVDEAHHKRVPDEAVQGPGIKPWGVTDYLEELQRLAQERGMSLFDCAFRYSAVTVTRNAQGWRFHPALGFAKAQV